MRLSYLLFIILANLPFLASGQQNAGENSGKKVSGEASLLTNYVWHGLTQSKRNPAIQSSFFYYLASSFRAGLSGSNVSYYANGYGRESKANALLKIHADIMLKFSQNFGMDLNYSDNRYFESDDRDGNTFTIKFNTFTYGFGVEQEGNWQGTVTKARYYFVEKPWDVFGSWKWNNKLGYTQFEEAPGIKNYFDVRSGIGKKWGATFWEGTLTFTNENSQFGDSADYFFILSGTAYF